MRGGASFNHSNGCYLPCWESSLLHFNTCVTKKQNPVKPSSTVLVKLKLYITQTDIVQEIEEEENEENKASSNEEVKTTTTVNTTTH